MINKTPPTLKYKRILLKCSGEALMGSLQFGIDPSVLDQIASDVAELIQMGVEVGLVIGGGGKTIKEIKEKSGAEITIEDDGTVYFTGKGNSTELAKAVVEEMTHEFKVGEMLKGKVVKIADFGAFVALNPFADGMVHISEMAPFRVDRVSDIIKEGMIVPVKVINIDLEKGRIGLSIKEADKDFFSAKGGSA